MILTWFDCVLYCIISSTLFKAGHLACLIYAVPLMLRTEQGPPQANKHYLQDGGTGVRIVG